MHGTLWNIRSYGSKFYADFLNIIPQIRHHLNSFSPEASSTIIYSAFDKWSIHLSVSVADNCIYCKSITLTGCPIKTGNFPRWEKFGIAWVYLYIFLLYQCESGMQSHYNPIIMGNMLFVNPNGIRPLLRRNSNQEV